MPLLSIITINLNNAIGLQRTIESVVSQYFKDFEFIVIDGLSSDGSLDIVKHYSSKINISVSELDNGIYDAMNKGAKLAGGKYLLFLNSGDWLTNKNVLADLFKNVPDANILYGDVIYVYPNKKLRYKKQPRFISIEYLLHKTILHPAAFIERNFFFKCGEYNLNCKIAADYSFFLNAVIVQSASTFYLNKAVSFHSFDGVSSRQENFIKINNERSLIQKEYFSQEEIANAQSKMHHKKNFFQRLTSFLIERWLMLHYKLFSHR